MKIPSYRYHFVIALMLGISSPLVGFGESNGDRYSLIQEGERQDLLSGDGGSAHHDEASMHCETEGLLRLTALDSLDGPPPCGKDNVCNMAACSNDPDCPAGLPQNTPSEPSDPPHDEKGSLSVWLSTGPDGYEGGHSCDFDQGTCNIKVNWSVQPDKYDKWKICWKDWGDTFTNACDEHQIIRDYENNFYVIPNLQEGQHYRIRLEGRKDKNDKWACLVKARLRNVHLNGTNIKGVVPCFVP